MNIKNYQELTDKNKREIINNYYEFRQLNFKELTNKLNVSERSIGRVLKENDINTKRKNRYTINERFFSDIDTEEIKRLVCRTKSDSKDIYNYLYKNSKIYMERKYTKWNYILSAFTE